MPQASVPPEPSPKSPPGLAPRLPPQPSVLVVILNYGEPEATLAAVHSVLGSTYPDFSVLVVDNGSIDGSAALLSALDLPGVEVESSPVNLGFTGGMNLGLRRGLRSGKDFVWMLNNDVLVAPGTLSSLVALAISGRGDGMKIGLVSPRIATLDQPPRLTFVGGIVDIGAQLYDETNDPAEAERWLLQYPRSGLVVGTAALVPVALLREIGELDQRFFMYYEDVDLCARSSAAGYRNLVDRASTVVHREKNRDRDPAGMKPHYWYYNARNSIRFWRKYLGLLGSLKQTSWTVNRYLRLRNRCRKTPGASQAILAGLWHGLLDRGGAWDASFRMPAPIAAVFERYSRRAALRESSPAPVAPPSE